MLTERLAKRCSSAACRNVASVPGYRFTFSKRSVDLSGKGNILAAAGKTVFGVLFDLDERHLAKLDSLEGVGYGYDRIDQFQIQMPGSDEALQVITYLADKAHTDENLSPYHWYLDLVLAGARQHGLPNEYVQNIEATRSVEDPWPDRPERREALELLEALPIELYKRR